MASSLTAGTRVCLNPRRSIPGAAGSPLHAAPGGMSGKGRIVLGSARNLSRHLAPVGGVRRPRRFQPALPLRPDLAHVVMVLHLRQRLCWPPVSYTHLRAHETDSY